MITRSDQLAALGRFLADTDYSGAALKACVREMVNHAARRAGSYAMARETFLQAFPADKRAIMAAMLPKQNPGRTKGKSPHTYARHWLLYHEWCEQRRANPTLTKKEFCASRFGAKADPDKILERARNDLSAIDRQVLEHGLSDI